MLSEGIDRKAIATAVGASPAQVAAIAAHVTMQTYSKNPTVTTKQETNQGSNDSYSRLVETAAPSLGSKFPLQHAQLRGGPIPIGTDIDTGDLRFWSPTPEEGTPNPHLLIVGESGSGKTYATQCLCAEFAQRSLPTIIFDFGQGFSLDAIPREFTEYSRPLEIRAGEDGININPLQIFPSDLHGPVNVAQRVADTFARVYSSIGVQQHAVLRDAVLYTFIRAGIDPDERTTWKLAPPSFSNLRDALGELATSGMSSARRYAGSVASHISTVFIFNTFRNTGLNLDWQQMLEARDHAYIIQLKGLEHSLERVVTELLLWNLLGFLESLGPGYLRCMVLIDEAHRMSFASNSPIEKLLREGRKFGVGVILASQQPEDFSSVAFANTATKLVFNVGNDKGFVTKQLARKVPGNGNLIRLVRRVSNLRRSQACLITHEMVTIVDVQSFREREHNWRLST